MHRSIVPAAIALMILSLVAYAQKSAAPTPATAKKPAAQAPATTSTAKTPAKTPAKKAAPKTATKAKPKAPAPKQIAPDTLAHPIALFLSQMCSDGKKKVTFKANAIGTRFFFEEPTGVTIYGFDGVAYRKESFVKGATIEKVLKRYAPRTASGTS